MSISIYSLYKTTNTVNGMIYIGIHKETMYPEIDSYLGSGTHITDAIHKHGRHIFNREILFVSGSREIVLGAERLYVNKEFIKESNNYNHRCGGAYCYNQPDTTGEGNSFFGKTHSMESRKKMSESAKKRKPMSEATRKKIGKASSERKRKPFSDEAKKKMSISASKRKRAPHSKETKRRIGEAAKQRHLDKLAKQ